MFSNELNFRSPCQQGSCRVCSLVKPEEKQKEKPIQAIEMLPKDGLPNAYFELPKDGLPNAYFDVRFFRETIYHTKY